MSNSSSYSGVLGFDGPAPSRLQTMIEVLAWSPYMNDCHTVCCIGSINVLFDDDISASYTMKACPSLTSAGSKLFVD